MRSKKRRGVTWAAWLGLVALAVNALVPVHLAFDLAEAIAPKHQHQPHDETGGPERRLLALISGHREAAGRTHEHSKHQHGNHEHGQHHGCPVCSALGALAGLAPPTLAVLSAPLPARLPAVLPLVASQSARVPAAYRSRAPPIS